jgi:hypothetical protein
VGLVHHVAVDAPGRGRSAPVERDLGRTKPGEVVVEVLVRRLDDVVERLACSPRAQLLGSPPMLSTARSTANVAGRSGGSSNSRVEMMRYLALSAGRNVSCASEKRGIVTRTSPSPTARSALGSSGMCSPPVGSGRRAGLQRAASRSGPLSSSYVTKPSPAAAAACVSGVTASAPRADRWGCRFG